MSHPLVETIDTERRNAGRRGFTTSITLAAVSGTVAFMGITAPGATSTALPVARENKQQIERLQVQNARQRDELRELKSLLMVCVTDRSRPECVNVPKGSTVLPVLQRINSSDDDDDDDGGDESRTVVVTPPNSSPPSDPPSKAPKPKPSKERERPDHGNSESDGGSGSGNSQGRH
jgi:cell division septation protein DedD